MIEPNPTARGAAFWEGADSGELRVQVCLDCGSACLPAALRCRKCASSRQEWRSVEPEAEVLAITTVHRAAHPALADSVPYRSSVVSLGEFCNVPLFVAPQADEDITVGSRVRIEFAEVAGARRVPVVAGLARRSEAVLREKDDETSGGR